MLEFVSQNKYVLETTIRKKWPKNQIDPKEDTYKSPRLVYYKDADALVPVVRTNIETMPPRLESWSDNDKDKPEDMVESSTGVHDEMVSNL
jgi:hypothetical protein